MNNSEIITAAIAIISGGALTGIINAVHEQRKNKREESARNVDDRIQAWQKISDKNESRMEQLERKLYVCCEKDFHNLDRYADALENLILRLDPTIELPPRPALEQDKNTD